MNIAIVFILNKTNNEKFGRIQNCINNSEQKINTHSSNNCSSLPKENINEIVCECFVEKLIFHSVASLIQMFCLNSGSKASWYDMNPVLEQNH